ncbi:pseudouridine synthase [Oceanimonas baumannii]|uniref:Pseudouridine synthase n=1 Tax=Oceanimonas baumannii TaxID=129578 RepID=A0A235CG85_9GAMM|nr:pseudouridine synthase [Oceanimonas baumannii]OYD23572.1 16S rRNA pseudouridine(516) synthase [Oceanimonas baumannii]TDW56891.1 16S rRNA pseudouridine516 synthase [Oceanimonas baumannii]
MRLDKFICKSTELSRTGARQAIQAGEARVNGEVITNEAAQVHENNHITLGGQQLEPRPFRYLMMHKPAGSLCSNVDGSYPSLFRWLHVERPDELHIVGRLDADTTGLVLLTDDGRWSFNITRPEQQCEKVYRVGLRDPLVANVADRFAQGLLLQGESKPTQPAVLAHIGPREVLLTITEGRFHQVKRMFAAVGNRVLSLHREQIGGIRLDVPLGHWRELTPAEIENA